MYEFAINHWMPSQFYLFFFLSSLFMLLLYRLSCRHDVHVVTVLFTLNRWKVQSVPLNHQHICVLIRVMFVSIFRSQVAQGHPAHMNGTKMNWIAIMMAHAIDLIAVLKAHRQNVSISRTSFQYSLCAHTFSTLNILSIFHFSFFFSFQGYYR